MDIRFPLYLPKIEKITKDTTLTHFFLMFGYKLYSLYFPLFLIAKSLSLAQIGYTNFLIYLPIAIFAPFVGFLSHKINPAVLSSIGILGYGIHALGMIIFPNLFTFYLFNIILGISAALFFVSSRAILMGSKLENYDRAFAWYYSAPSWADAVAPAIGALIIWKFGFNSVFVLSLILQFFAAIFCWLRLKTKVNHWPNNIRIQESSQHYIEALKILRRRDSLAFILISFLVLILIGFNNTFFVLFLKELNFSQNQIFVFVSILSAVFIPISLWVIKLVSKVKSEANICRGSQIAGVFSILLGGISAIMNFYFLFFIMLANYIGNLITSSGRSGLLSVKLKQYPEESAALDTILPPLATAFGALIGGLIISLLGYLWIFILFGGLLFGAGSLGKRFAKSQKIE